MSLGTENRYLEGNYGPVSEEITAVDLPVQGAIPPELSGRYVRIGPNPVTMPEGPYHWFVGDGMVHGVQLQEGRAAWYRNRWVRTPGVAQTLGDSAPSGPAPPMYDVSNTNVMAHAGRLLSFTEGAMPYELGPELETIGRCDFGGPLASGFTAHPKIDPDTGEMLGFAYWFEAPYLRYHVIDADGRLVRTEDIETPGPTMIHDFAITERNVVFFDLPVVFDLEWAMNGQPMPFRWMPEYGARVGVMPRDGGSADVRWADVELCYVFHPLNAYDDGDRVVVDVTRHPEMFNHSRTGPWNEQAPTLDRWTIDPVAGKVIEERLDDRPNELPRVDPRVVGRRHRYGYAAHLSTIDGEAEDFGGLLKYDLDRGTTEVHDVGPGRHAAEGTFVPASDAAGEDEGWVLSYVYDEASDTSELVVLDATDFTGAPVATVPLPQRVPYGFHGTWVPD